MLNKFLYSSKPNNDKDMILCCSKDYYKSALYQIRLQSPLSAGGFQIIHKMSNNEFSIDLLKEIDYVVIQRDFPSNINLYFYILESIRKFDIPIIYEIDDLLFELPKNHPLMRNGCYSVNFIPMLKAVCDADLVTVSTQPIADYLQPFNPNIKVLPNYLIDEFWSFLPIGNEQKNPEKLVIGYLGGSTHSEDLKLVLEPLLEINNRYPGKIQFEFWGSHPPNKLKERASVKVRPIIPDYEKFSKSIQNQKYDILIAPLRDNKFNQAKSNIKYLEYSTLGAPGVFSEVKPFKEIIQNGKNGFLASSSKEWFDCLKTLIEIPAKRQEIAQSAQKMVKNDFMLSQHAEDWWNAYHSIKANMKQSKTGSKNKTIEQREMILKHIFSVQKDQCEKSSDQYRADKSITKTALSKLISVVSKLGKN